MASGGATNAAAASGDAGKVSKGNDIVKYTLEQLLELREANMAATIQVIETLHALGLYEYHGSSPFPSDLRASRMVTRTREPRTRTRAGQEGVKKGTQRDAPSRGGHQQGDADPEWATPAPRDSIGSRKSSSEMLLPSYLKSGKPNNGEDAPAAPSRPSVPKSGYTSLAPAQSLAELVGAAPRKPAAAPRAEPKSRPPGFEADLFSPSSSVLAGDAWLKDIPLEPSEEAPSAGSRFSRMFASEPEEDDPAAVMNALLGKSGSSSGASSAFYSSPQKPAFAPAAAEPDMFALLVGSGAAAPSASTGPDVMQLAQLEQQTLHKPRPRPAPAQPNVHAAVPHVTEANARPAAPMQNPTDPEHMINNLLLDTDFGDDNMHFGGPSQPAAMHVRHPMDLPEQKPLHHQQQQQFPMQQIYRAPPPQMMPQSAHRPIVPPAAATSRPVAQQPASQSGMTLPQLSMPMNPQQQSQQQANELMAAVLGGSNARAPAGQPTQLYAQQAYAQQQAAGRPVMPVAAPSSSRPMRPNMVPVYAAPPNTSARPQMNPTGDLFRLFQQANDGSVARAPTAPTSARPIVNPVWQNQGQSIPTADSDELVAALLRTNM